MSDFASSLPIRTETNGDVVAKISDGTTNTQLLAVDAAGLVGAKLYDGAGTAVTSQANGGQQALDVGIDVAGVQIDPRQIRALTSSDVVTADQGAPNTASNGWPVKPTDGTNSQSFTAAGEAKVDITQPLPAGTNAIGTVKAQLQDNAGTAITLGQKVMASSVPVVIASDQSTLNVSFAPAPSGTLVNKYNTSAAVAAAASVNHDYSVTAGKTFYAKKFWASASGKIKAEVRTSPDGTTFTSFWVGFNSTANPNIDIDLETIAITDTGAGAKVRIVITNEDKSAEDVYSTISGVEV